MSLLLARFLQSDAPPMDKLRATDFILPGLLVAVAAASLPRTGLGVGVLILLGAGAVNLTGYLLALRKRRTLFVSVFLFNLIFFLAAAVQQIGFDFDPILRDGGVVARAAAYVLVYSAICLAVIARVRPLARPPSGPRPAFSWPTAGLSLGCGLACLAILGRDVISSREAYGAALHAGEEASYAIYLTSMLQWIAAFGALSSIFAVRRARSWPGLAAWLAVLLALLVCNPTISPRYMLFALASGGLLYALGLGESRKFVWLAAAGVLASPLFEVFRSSAGGAPVAAYDRLFVSMDFELFSLFCHALYYIQAHGLMWGANLLGAALFWAPRALWPGKPEPSSYYLMDSLSVYRHYWSDNLSTPLAAELVLAFGLVGLVVGMAVFCVALARLEDVANARPRSPLALFAAALAGLLFLVLRGTLMVGCNEVAFAALAAVAVQLAGQARAASAGLRAPASGPPTAHA